MTRDRQPAADDPTRLSVTVAHDDPCFGGHFPGDPTLPASAQLAVLVLPRVQGLWPDLGAPSEVRRFKLHAAIRPGDALTLTLARADDQVRFELRRGTDLCTSGVLTR